MNKIKESTRSRALGLTESEVMSSRAINGENLLPRAKRRSFFKKFISNMGDPVIRILLLALAVKLLFLFRDSDLIETVGIAASVLLATLISTLSEQGSERAFDRLEADSLNELCRVRRSVKGRSEVVRVPMSEVVVGDIVMLSAGDRIPADGVLISGELFVDQSGLNGESREAKKTPAHGFRPDLSDPSSVFGGCTVLSGEGEMEVARVGEAGFLGGISREIQSETRESPLKLRLTKLAKQISIIGYVAAALCSVAYLVSSLLISPPNTIDREFLFSEVVHALTLGLTVVVMAVPEGLPTMIAVVLSANIKRMVRDSVLVRKPVGIEAAGSMNVLFTDKTGTVTEGRMRVGGVMLSDGTRMSPRQMGRSAPRQGELYGLFARFGEADVTSEGAVGGNATERAIAESAEGIRVEDGYKLSRRIPFDSEKKYSAVRLIGKGDVTLIKGAPEVLLPYVTTCLDKSGREVPISSDELMKRVLSPTKSGWRVIAMCISHTPLNDLGGLTSLCFVCSVMIADRPRAGAACAVESLRRAGIQTVMITGDNRETAMAIAEKCGIIRFGDELCMTREELAKKSDDELKELLPKLRVVARALPSDKSRLVRVAQELGLVVGMTGDGVNDAPALKRADIGFSMGSGTGVAKEAGDIVILDNDLTSIAKAVLYGRNIFKSIRKFIVLQLTINLCAVGVTMIGPFIGIESPVTVVQMLWINIIMDTLGGIAFAGEPALESCMREKPKKRDEMILNKYMIEQISLLGVFTVTLSVCFLKHPAISGRFLAGEGGDAHLTAFFAFFIFAGVFNCFNSRTDSLDLFKGFLKNRAFGVIMAAVALIQIGFVYLGGAVLRTVPLAIGELSFTLFMALLVFPFDFLRKLTRRLSGQRDGY